MLRPSGVADAPPARRVRGRRSSLVLGVLVLTAVVSTRWVRLNLSPSVPVGLYGLIAVPAQSRVGPWWCSRASGGPALAVLGAPAETRGGGPRRVVCVDDEGLAVAWQ